MGAQADKAKGHVKEAAGIVTGSEKLQAEGKADQRSGAIEEKVDQANNWVNGLFSRLKGALHLK